MILIFRRSIKERIFQKLEKPLPGSWIFVVNPSEEEIDFLEKEISMEKSQILDALDEFETPHLELIKNQLYIFVRSIFQEEKKFLTFPVLFVITEKFLVTITRDDKGFFTPFIRGEIPFFTTQQTKTLLLFLNKINEGFRKSINFLSKEIEYYQRKIEEIKEKEFIEISEKEIELSSILTSLISMEKVYETLLTKEYLAFLREEKDLIDDLFLTTKETIEISNSLLKRVHTIKDVYFTFLQNKINKVIQILTLITVLFGIPTAIFSFYGMNLFLPFQEKKLTSFFVLGFTFSLMILFWFIFKRKKLI